MPKLREQIDKRGLYGQTEGEDMRKPQKKECYCYESESEKPCGNCRYNQGIENYKKYHNQEIKLLELFLENTRADVKRLKEENAELLEALKELVDLMQRVIEGDYKPGYYTLKPGQQAIDKVEQQCQT